MGACELAHRRRRYARVPTRSDYRPLGDHRSRKSFPPLAYRGDAREQRALPFLRR
jgi:hypothetical protein